MKPFLNDRGLLVCAVAASLLVGCVSSSPFSSRVPSAPAVVPEVVHPNAHSTLVTLLYEGRPIVRNSKAWLLNDKDEIVRQTVTDADGFAHFRLIDPNEALKLKYESAYTTCKGEWPFRECTEHLSIYQWPAKVHDPPFPAYLECDGKKPELCKKQ